MEKLTIATQPIAGQKPGTSGLRKKTHMFMGPHYLESFVQAIWNGIGGVAGKTGAYHIDGKVRQLTKRECLRVQGFPETFNFPKEISKGQVYKMCGNSVSVPVISKIYQKVKSAIN